MSPFNGRHFCDIVRNMKSIKLIGRGPVLEINGTRIKNLVTSESYDINGSYISLVGNGPIYEIKGNAIKEVYGSYKLELNGNMLYSLTFGNIAEINGSFIRYMYGGNEYELPEGLTKLELLAIIAILFGKDF